MFASKFCGLDAPDERCADTFNFIGSDLFTITRATQDDSDGVRIFGNSLSCRDAEIRVIIEGVKFIWPMISDVMSTSNEVMDEFIFELKARVVAADVNAHAQFNHGIPASKRKPAK